MTLKHLPTGCPISIPDPAARKHALENARLDLWDRILVAQEQITAIGHEIDLCDMEINEAKAVAAVGVMQ